jgi:hypothetical protein
MGRVRVTKPGRGKVLAAKHVSAGRRDDMNIDIDENDCIVVETKGGEVGKRGAGMAGSENPTNGGASAPSPEVRKRVVDDRGGWTRVANNESSPSDSCSSPTHNSS